MPSSSAAAGRFITLEGGEGVGKTTQTRLLAEWLGERGIDVATTREPGGSPGAEEIRGLLTDPASEWTPASEALLLFAARANHHVMRIAPALKRGAWVVSDRFADSTRAYQGYGQGLDLAAIDMRGKFALGDFEPDLTFVLDLPVEAAFERLRARAGKPDRYERMDPAFHQRLREGFLEIAANSPDRCRVIAADAPPERIAGTIRAAVGERFPVAAA